MQLEEITRVMLDYDGAPVGFCWRNRDYLVASKPVRWYSRKLWWENTESAQKGIGAALLEVEMWRMWAISDQQRIFFELIHNQPQDNWVVQEISQQ